MKKLLLLIPILFLLSGCPFSKTVTETVYRPIFPPDALVQTCEPKRPERASLSDVIRIQDKALDQCNQRILSIQEWIELEEENWKEEEEQKED